MSTMPIARTRRRCLVRATLMIAVGLVVIATAVLAGLVGLTVTAPTFNPQPRPPPQDLAEARDRVRQALERYVDERPLVPGAALSVTTAEGQSLYAGSAGKTTLSGRIAPLGGQVLTPGHEFRTASVTKTFTAAAILRLMEDRRLSLDDPITDHLPAELVDRVQSREADVTRRRITVRQLLNHTSGIYDYATDPGWMLRVALQPEKTWTPHELVDYALAAGEPYGPPGERFNYSDTGYVLLGFIIERRTGQPLAAAYRQLLPLDGFPSTYLEGREPGPVAAVPRADQYLGPLNLTGHDPSFDTFGGGGLVSTVADLDAFTRALFTGRLFRRHETLERMLETVEDGRGNAYGLGIGLVRLGGEDVWLHTGFFGAFIAYVPRLGLSVAGSTNQTLATPDAMLTTVIEIGAAAAAPGAIAAHGGHR